MAQPTQHPWTPLNDQEVLERLAQLARPSKPLSKKFFWRMTIGLSLFASLPFIFVIAGWPERWWGPRWNALVLLGIHALASLLPAAIYQFSPDEGHPSTPVSEQEHLIYKKCFLTLMFMTWFVFFGSIETLLISLFMVLHYFPWFPWWAIIGIGLGFNLGLWVGRMAVWRAFVEGPEVHPWLRSLSKLYSLLSNHQTAQYVAIAVLTLGYGIVRFLAVTIPNIAMMIVLLIFICLYILLAGSAVLGISLTRVCYQKWRGAEALRP